MTTAGGAPGAGVGVSWVDVAASAAGIYAQMQAVGGQAASGLAAGMNSALPAAMSSVMSTAGRQASQAFTTSASAGLSAGMSALISTFVPHGHLIANIFRGHGQESATAFTQGFMSNLESGLNLTAIEGKVTNLQSMFGRMASVSGQMFTSEFTNRVTSGIQALGGISTANIEAALGAAGLRGGEQMIRNVAQGLEAGLSTLGGTGLNAAIANLLSGAAVHGGDIFARNLGSAIQAGLNAQGTYNFTTLTNSLRAAAEEGGGVFSDVLQNRMAMGISSIGPRLAPSFQELQQAARAAGLQIGSNLSDAIATTYAEGFEQLAARSVPSIEQISQKIAPAFREGGDAARAEMAVTAQALQSQFIQLGTQAELSAKQIAQVMGGAFTTGTTEQMAVIRSFVAQTLADMQAAVEANGPNMRAAFKAGVKGTGNDMYEAISMELMDRLEAKGLAPVAENIGNELRGMGQLGGTALGDNLVNSMSQSVSSGLGGKLQGTVKNTMSKVAELGGGGEAGLAVGGAMVAGVVAAVVLGASHIVSSIKDLFGLVNKEAEAFLKVGKDAGESFISGFKDVVDAKMPDVSRAIGVGLEGIETTLQMPLNAISTAMDVAIIGKIPIIGSALHGMVDEASSALSLFFGVFNEYKNVATEFAGVLVDIGNKWQDVARTIAGQTIDLGNLEKYTEVVRDIAASGDLVHFKDVAQVVGELNQRLSGLNDGAGLTRQQLINLATTVGEAQELLGDIKINVDNMTAAFNDFGIPAEKTNEELTFMVNVARETGVNFNELTRDIDQVAPALMGLGYNLEQVTFILGKMNEKLGDPAMNRWAFGVAQIEDHFEKLGYDQEHVNQALGDTVEIIRGYLAAGNEMAAFDWAKNIVGSSRTAKTVVDAIKQGILGTPEEIQALIDKAGATLHQPLDQALEATKSLQQALEQLSNTVLAALAPLGTALVESLNQAGAGITNWIQTHQAQFIEFVGQIGEWLLQAGVKLFEGLGAMLRWFGPAVEGAKNMMIDFLESMDLGFQSLFGFLKHIPDWMLTDTERALKGLATGAQSMIGPMEALRNTHLDTALNALAGGADWAAGELKGLEGPLADITGKAADAAAMMQAFSATFKGPMDDAPKFQLALQGSVKDGLTIPPEVHQQIIDQLNHMGVTVDENARGVITGFHAHTQAEMNALTTLLNNTLGPGMLANLGGTVKFSIDTTPEQAKKDFLSQHMGVPSEFIGPDGNLNITGGMDIKEPQWVKDFLAALKPATEPPKPQDQPQPGGAGDPTLLIPIIGTWLSWFNQLFNDNKPGAHGSAFTTEMPGQVTIREASAKLTLDQIEDSMGIPNQFRGPGLEGVILPAGLNLPNASVLTEGDMLDRAGIPAKYQGEVEAAGVTLMGVLLPSQMDLKSTDTKSTSQIMDALGIPEQLQKGDDGAVIPVSFELKPGAPGGGPGVEPAAAAGGELWNQFLQSHPEYQGQGPGGPGLPGGQVPLGPDAGKGKIEAAKAIIAMAKARGFTPEQTEAVLSTGLQESGLEQFLPSGEVHTGGGGAWHGIFQQDTSYPGRDTAAGNIQAFFDRLGAPTANIWEQIFKLQQGTPYGSPGARRAYMGEIQSRLQEAIQLYNQLAGMAGDGTGPGTTTRYAQTGGSVDTGPTGPQLPDITSPEREWDRWLLTHPGWTSTGPQIAPPPGAFAGGGHARVSLTYHQPTHLAPHVGLPVGSTSVWRHMQRGGFSTADVPLLPGDDWDTTGGGRSYPPDWWPWAVPGEHWAHPIPPFPMPLPPPSQWHRAKPWGMQSGGEVGKKSVTWGLLKGIFGELGVTGVFDKIPTGLLKLLGITLPGMQGGGSLWEQFVASGGTQLAGMGAMPAQRQQAYDSGKVLSWTDAKALQDLFSGHSPGGQRSSGIDPASKFSAESAAAANPFGMATGGEVPGAHWPGRDSVPMGLAAGSYVVRRDQALLNRDLIDQIMGGAGGHGDGAHTMLPALVQPQERVIPPKIAQANLALLDAINYGKGRMIARQGGGSVLEAEEWAAFASGHPYNTDSYLDCSGYVSSVWGVMAGYGPGRHFTTDSLARDYERFGFHKGYMPGAFNIADNPQSGQSGHMIAELPNGVRIESGGPDNVIKYGTSTPMSAGQFTEHYYWLPPSQNPNLGTSGIRFADFSTAGPGGNASFSTAGFGVGGAPETPAGGEPGAPGQPGGGPYEQPPLAGPELEKFRVPEGTPGAITIPGVGTFAFSWDLPESRGITDKERGQMDAYLNKMRQALQRGADDQTRLGDATDKLRQDTVERDTLQGELDKLERDFLEGQRALAAQQGRAYDEGEARRLMNLELGDKTTNLGKKYDELTKANAKVLEDTKALGKASENLTNNQIQQRIDAEKRPDIGKEKMTPDENAAALGAGLIKGAAQELGFPDVFGKPPWQWGIWKLGAGVAGFGLNLLNALGDQGGGLPGAGGPGGPTPTGQPTGPTGGPGAPGDEKASIKPEWYGAGMPDVTGEFPGVPRDEGQAKGWRKDPQTGKYVPPGQQTPFEQKHDLKPGQTLDEKKKADQANPPGGGPPHAGDVWVPPGTVGVPPNDNKSGYWANPNDRSKPTSPLYTWDDASKSWTAIPGSGAAAPPPPPPGRPAPPPGPAPFPFNIPPGGQPPPPPGYQYGPPQPPEVPGPFMPPQDMPGAAYRPTTYEFQEGGFRPLGAVPPQPGGPVEPPPRWPDIIGALPQVPGGGFWWNAPQGPLFIPPKGVGPDVPGSPYPRPKSPIPIPDPGPRGKWDWDWPKIMGPNWPGWKIRPNEPSFMTPWQTYQEGGFSGDDQQQKGTWLPGSQSPSGAGSPGGIDIFSILSQLQSQSYPHPGMGSMQSAMAWAFHPALMAMQHQPAPTMPHTKFDNGGITPSGPHEYDIPPEYLPENNPFAVPKFRPDGTRATFGEIYNPNATRFAALTADQKAELRAAFASRDIGRISGTMQRLMFGPDHPVGPVGSLPGEAGYPKGPLYGVPEPILPPKPFQVAGQVADIAGILNLINRTGDIVQRAPQQTQPFKPPLGPEIPALPLRGVMAGTAVGTLGTAVTAAGAAGLGVPLGVAGAAGLAGAAALMGVSTAFGAATGQESDVTPGVVYGPGGTVISAGPRAPGHADGYLPSEAMIQGARPHLVQWAEPSTGGEAFIPLNGGGRSRDIWAQTGRKLGVYDEGGFRPAASVTSHMTASQAPVQPPGISGALTARGNYIGTQVTINNHGVTPGHVFDQQAQQAINSGTRTPQMAGGAGVPK